MVSEVTAGDWVAAVLAIGAAVLAAASLPPSPNRGKLRAGVVAIIAIALGIGFGSLLISGQPQLVVAGAIAIAILGAAMAIWPDISTWARAAGGLAVAGACIAGTVTVVRGLDEGTNPGQARTEGVVLSGLGTEVPRCNAHISGTAPREDRDEVWLAHRDRDSDDSNYYYNKATWIRPNSNNWELTMNIGSADDAGHTIEFVAFVLDEQNSAFLQHLSIIEGPPPNTGFPLYSKFLPLGVDADQIDRTAERLAQPSC
jgi:hypothetical protein